VMELERLSDALKAMIQKRIGGYEMSVEGS
jgi:hypothetical protein